MRRLIVIGLSALFTSWGVHAQPFTANYVFGDSLSDIGNDYAVTGGQVPAATGYTNGRFSNGNNYVDYLNVLLGLAPEAPSVLGGNDYAYGGARTSSNALGDLNPAFNALNFNNEIAMFAAAHPAADSAALYTVFMGANDLFAALMMDPVTGQAYMQQSISDIGAGIDTLVALGARNILLPNLPDLGLIPRTDDANSALVSAITAQFNAGVDAYANAIAALNPAVNIFRFDTYTALQDVVNDPVAYGMTNVSDSCFSGSVESPVGTTCSTPDSYVFWDEMHPTTAMHEVLANEMYASISSVPEPQSWSLLLLGVGALIVVQRRFRARVAATARV